MADQNFMDLPQKTTPTAGSSLLMGNASEAYRIDYDKLADAILNKLTSKSYSGLQTSAKNLVAAINELNSKILNGNEGAFESFDSIPYPSWGTYVLSDSIKPDPDSAIYQGFCFGTKNSRSILLIRPYTKKVYVNGKPNDGDWSEWKTVI